jgi:hypothetical protein
MIRRYAIALAVASLAPAAAFAETDTLSYSYFQAQYLNTKLEAQPDGGCPATFECTDEAEGLQVGLGVSLMEYLSFVGSYDQRLFGASDFQGPTRWSFAGAGFGIHTLPKFWDGFSNFQLFGNVTYEQSVIHNRTDSGTGDNNETDYGYGVEGGVRVPLPNLELQASYKHYNLGKAEDVDLKVFGDRYGGGVLVQLTPYFDLTANYQHIEHRIGADWAFDEWLVGFRSYFATDIEKYKRKGGLLTGWLGE